ncbi:MULTISPECIES: hypothetical protein [Rhizobium/Agrobacterium group]|uniref:Tail fiber assembly protein n=1 Tax=Agrobacterium vitis TaxID=373 RepID=A0ABD6HB71_AGRVI|nr:MULTISPECIES: hypothetical protein [Rhizobium/Agrobacterium group]MCF1448567.1 hypothetical protein [Allorhizobium ampelinum]MCF1463530.1 hypothetical protein [Allorhizobium ampelinum]MCF1494157.1 hypothetical protein [Allorhizobium ampelinum]MUO30047.1 hypothetical protein [Agrobacterium vitis]MUO45689.1 hypothetical protein [Agrobacterium vitis]
MTADLSTLVPAVPAQSLTIDYNGQTYAGFNTDALADAGVPQTVIKDAQALAHHEAVKAECRRRIYAVGSSEAQMNVTSMTAAISAKTEANRTAEEKAIVAAASQSIEWVTAMRGRFAELAEDMEANYLADASWPECPQAVIDLYAQF